MKVCIVTPTGARPELFALLVKCVEAQVRQPDLWLIATDNDEQESSFPYPSFGRRLCYSREQIEQVKAFDPTNRSLSLALREVPDDHATLIFEDDDYYSPGYINEHLIRMELGDFQLTGSNVDHRYHMLTGQWVVVEKPMPNAGACCLAPGIAKVFADWLIDPNSSREFWAPYRRYYGGPARISMKGVGYGLPGRKGRTHSPTNPNLKKWWRDAEKYERLRGWLGDAAESYIALAEEFQCRSVP